ncbi:hypothetical protein [Mycolicibacterium mucogenicum]|uniref:hypothetical protein n=1 Tax=Mycolicibacterium mucogenicum TaxID=56689 RepID=UPI000AFB2FC8|nr:hypothetical protein [Mycolicibacterium mucogenicum]
MTGPQQEQAEQLAQELLGPMLTGSMVETVNKCVRIGVSFSVECIETAAEDYAQRGETAVAEALRDVARAIPATAEQLFQPTTTEQER